MTVAPRFRRARELAGLTLAQAAKLLGWAHGPLHAIEIGAGAPPSDADLARLAALYQTTVAWLLGDEPKLSAENELLLGEIEPGRDRAMIREVMELWSTLELTK